MKTTLLSITFICLIISSSWCQSDPFAGRPTSPGSDIASSKENIPDKKETFTTKLERYKKKGFKVAVVLASGEIKSETPSPVSTTSSLTKVITLKESLPSVKSDLMPLAEDLTNKMNEAFSTDIFELVDMSKIPYQESKFGKVDDWGSTIYKMVLTYSATPVYSYTETSGRYEGKMYVNLYVTGTEFVNTSKGIKMKYPIRAGNLGAYSTSIMSWTTNPNLQTVSQLKNVVRPPEGDGLYKVLKSEHDAKIGEFIEKRK